jgi:preprotein translocase SecE subunit
MGNRTNKKKPQTGGLQPKGGAYANQEALAMEGVDPMVANAALKEKEKETRAKQKQKAKEARAEKRKNKRTMWHRIRDTAMELKKVRWPSFRTTIRKTGVVLAVVLIFGIVIFAIDMGLGELYKLLTDKFD